MFQVERAHHPVLGGAHRQFHHPDLAHADLRRYAFLGCRQLQGPADIEVGFVFLVGIKLIGIVGKDRDLGEDIGQGADRR